MSKHTIITPDATEVKKREAVRRTAEFVSPKHPDKLCDQISDALLDAHLTHDPHARVAIDVAGGHGTIFITGEVTTTATVDNTAIRAIVDRIVGLQPNGHPYEIIQRISQQSPEIAAGVDTGGAGDQGIMIGYATNETPDLLPLEYVLARNLNTYLYTLWPYDGKTQITLVGDTIETIVASFQHAPHQELYRAVKEWLATDPLCNPTGAAAPVQALTIHANPAGDWDSGGFEADAGLTGRKLAVDAYGPRIPLGGGAFSGKDGTKVDRSAAYMARKIAVDYLRQRHARDVVVQLAYAIGYSEPVQATVSIDGVQELITGYNLTPRGIIRTLHLTRPQFEQRARAGHFTLPL